MPDPSPIVPPASPPALPTPGPHEVPRTSVLRAVLGPVVFVGLLLLKFGKVAFIAVKGVKFFGTALSMLVSVGAYAVIFGLPFAVGFVALLFVHELGHALQMRREGIPVGPMVFIPFLGAVVAMKELPRDAAMEARVGIAGPILGTAGALVVHGAALVTGSDLLLALSFTAYFLNLFNLVPISPLDGGRIVAALSPKLWFAGIGLMALLFVLRPNPVLLIIVVLGALDSWSRFRRRGDEAAYYESVPVSFRVRLATAWIGLMVGLVVLMDTSHVERTVG